MGQKADNRAAKRTTTPVRPGVVASVIEPRTSYPVDPDRLITARGSRTRVEIAAGVAGFSSEKYRKIESGKTRTVVGSELLDLARTLGVPVTSLLASDHPARTGLSGRDDATRSLPTLSSTQSGHVERVLERVKSGTQIQSLTGPRGVGKTTLAMHLHKKLERRLGLAVRLVSMLDQCQPWELWRALGVQSIGRDADSGQTRVEVIDALRDDTAVLILDVDGMPSAATIEQIETIIQFCDELKIIATADRPLGLRDETTQPIEPVRFDARHVSTADDLGRTDEWQLVVAELNRERATGLLQGERLVELIKLLGMGDGTPQWFVAVGRELREREPGEIAKRIATHELSFSASEDCTWDYRVRRAGESLTADQISWLTILPREFAVEEVLGIGGLGAIEIERILHVAVDHWLVDRIGERYSVRRASQQACVRFAHGAHQRTIDALLARMPSHDAPMEELAAFDVHGHMAALHLAVINASKNQMPDLARRLIALLIPACLKPTRWNEVTAMAIDLERRVADIEDISRVPITRWAGTGALVTGDAKAGEYWAERCLELATKHIERGAGLNLRAACRLEGGELTITNLNAALADWVEARGLYEKVDDTISVQSMDANIAHVHESLGDLDAALASTHQWSEINGILCVQLGIVRARVLLRMGRTREALKVVESIHDEAAMANPMCSIACCTVLAFAALVRDGIEIPRSRLGDASEASSNHECPLAAEALACSKLIATFEGIDPGQLDRIDWKWIESVVERSVATNLQDASDVAGFAKRVFAALG